MRPHVEAVQSILDELSGVNAADAVQPVPGDDLPEIISATQLIARDPVVIDYALLHQSAFKLGLTSRTPEPIPVKRTRGGFECLETGDARRFLLDWVP
jgi:hypothetical protein